MVFFRTSKQVFWCVVSRKGFRYLTALGLKTRKCATHLSIEDGFSFMQGDVLRLLLLLRRCMIVPRVPGVGMILLPWR